MNFFRAGAILLLLFGIAHLAGHIAGQGAAPQNEQERQLKELLYGYKADLMGSMRSQGEILDGFSLAISVFMIGAGLMGLMLARSSDARLLGTLALAHCGWVGILLGISLRYWFLAPTTFLAAAFVCFLASAARLKGARSA
ncbi:MAG: hypothetical protein JNK48_32255 [Bryobacterales bacterium]|nr:hypothetical protein [Bryobacterales bacterium]